MTEDIYMQNLKGIHGLQDIERTKCHLLGLPLLPDKLRTYEIPNKIALLSQLCSLY